MTWRCCLAILLLFLISPGLLLAEEQSPTSHHDAAASGESAKAEEHPHLHGVHPLAVFPFAGLLLSIALLPLVAEHFWHSNRNRALVSILFALPVVIYLLYLQWGEGQPGILHLGESLHEYMSFIILLGSLYTVSGGIVLNFNARPSPLVNAMLLAIGAVIANFIGTTGASMLLIRPFLRINRPRAYTYHLPIFFIFMVSNLGGLLTPLGDPPLFLGFLRGVNFFWTLQLWPQWLMANSLLLVVFLVWDTAAWIRDPNRHSLQSDDQNDDPPATATQTPAAYPLRKLLGLFSGWVNFLFLAGIIAAVLLKSVLPRGTFLALFGSEALMVLMGILSVWLTPQKYREANAFGWGAIIEVAVLFIGIFITMVPALALLAEHGHEFGLTKPWQYFWLTGSLSSFLDNAPTYVTFATMASEGRRLDFLVHNEPLLLAAISCGAVFMGAMTYIGNGPNFMVKAIADESDYRTPSFFGYLLYSGCILVPIFGLVTFVFFLHGP